ncbi:helix-turn-helix transcriptional regulator [Sporosarcina ureae]|uniref:helix-turn-helix transcriptional regulator n=1 Tax=Sporosarcina ureae TaxID=1571 RepID=UPI000A17CC0E|nr:helix-turn-helix transcriptional regulator [Sporosarcina ureae]ARK21370.1 hypothetical protein SporoP32a_07380 [Sporosarcina ureae]
MDRMKEIRVRKGMKQKDIALEAGLSKASISLYENSKGNPSMNSAFKVARALGVTVDDLFSGGGEDNC